METDSDLVSNSCDSTTWKAVSDQSKQRRMGLTFLVHRLKDSGASSFVFLMLRRMSRNGLWQHRRFTWDERGTITFPDDLFVSGSHCRLRRQQGQTILSDLGSTNGTYIRIKEETALASGDFVLLGQQLFRVDLG